MMSIVVEPYPAHALKILLRSGPLLDQVEQALGAHPTVAPSIKLQADAADEFAGNYRTDYEPLTPQRVEDVLKGLHTAYLRSGHGVHTAELTELLGSLGVPPYQEAQVRFLYTFPPICSRE